MGEPAGSSGWGSWQLYSGTLRADGSAVSIFRLSVSNPGDPKLAAARNGVKRLRTLRHPNVLVFKDTAEVEERGETTVYLVTEPVRPLATVLDSIGVRGEERNQVRRRRRCCPARCLAAAVHMAAPWPAS